MGRKLIYVVLLLLSVYLEIMYDSTWILPMIAFLLLLAAGLFVLSFYYKMHIQVRGKVNIPVASREEEIPLELSIENSGLLPVSELEIILACENSYGRSVKKRSLTECIAGKSAQKRLVIYAKSGYSGRIRFSLQKVRVSDPLKLFSRKIPCQMDIFVNVLPDITWIPVVVTARTRNFPVDGEDYEENRSGDDPSEIFQIRQFREGDRLSQVHWKMSARMDTWMTKEYSMPKGYKVLFLLDCCGGQADPERMDRFLETAASVSASLQQAGCMHYTAWYDERDQRICRHGMEKDEDLYEMLDLLMSVPVPEQEYDMEAAYRSCYPEGAYSTVLRLDMDGRLYCNGNVAADFGEGPLKPQLTGFVLEV